jgi:hypothetical protein
VVTNNTTRTTHNNLALGFLVALLMAIRTLYLGFRVRNTEVAAFSTHLDELVWVVVNLIDRWCNGLLVPEIGLWCFQPGWRLVDYTTISSSYSHIHPFPPICTFYRLFLHNRQTDTHKNFSSEARKKILRGQKNSHQKHFQKNRKGSKGTHRNE